MFDELWEIDGLSECRGISYRNWVTKGRLTVYGYTNHYPVGADCQTTKQLKW